MAVLGKGISQSAGGRGRHRVAASIVALAAVLSLTNMRGADASQDPWFGAQWNLRQINAPAAWARSTGAGVRIGIVDSGVLANHEDLAGKVVAATDCVNTGGNPAACHGSGLDDTGHGTHMAGVAAATKDNGRGIAGVAPDAQLVVARVLTQNGGKIADVEAGIRWVVQHGAQVVNLSIGDNPLAQSPIDLSFTSAIEEAWAAGVIPVVTSGNTTSWGPARESFAKLDALVVGATDDRGVVTGYSNGLSSAKWGVVAPGGIGTGDSHDVISTWRDASAPSDTSEYAYRGGTSVAAAEVSGVAALLLAEGLGPLDAVQRIVTTARPIACGIGCHGLVDAGAAVGAAGSRGVTVNGAGRAVAVAPRVAGDTPAPASAGTPAAPTLTPPEVPGSTDVALAPPAVASDAGAIGRALAGAGPRRDSTATWIAAALAAAITSALIVERRYRAMAVP